MALLEAYKNKHSPQVPAVNLRCGWDRERGRRRREKRRQQMRKRMRRWWIRGAVSVLQCSTS